MKQRIINLIILHSTTIALFAQTGLYVSGGTSFFYQRRYGGFH